MPLKRSRNVLEQKNGMNREQFYMQDTFSTNDKKNKVLMSSNCSKSLQALSTSNFYGEIFPVVTDNFALLSALTSNGKTNAILMSSIEHWNILSKKLTGSNCVSNLIANLSLIFLSFYFSHIGNWGITYLSAKACWPGINRDNLAKAARNSLCWSTICEKLKPINQNVSLKLFQSLQNNASKFNWILLVRCWIIKSTKEQTH